MGILEAASKLREIVQHVANERGISEQEAWEEAIIEFRKKYEGSD